MVGENASYHLGISRKIWIFGIRLLCELFIEVGDLLHVPLKLLIFSVHVLHSSKLGIGMADDGFDGFVAGTDLIECVRDSVPADVSCVPWKAIL